MEDLILGFEGSGQSESKSAVIDEAAFMGSPCSLVVFSITHRCRKTPSCSC